MKKNSAAAVNQGGNISGQKSPLMPSSVVLTLRTTRRVRQPKLRRCKSGPAPRWSVSTPDGTTVYLAADERQQRSIALGIEKPVFYDLKPKDFSNMPDIEDADERRKRRREERANQ